LLFDLYESTDLEDWEERDHQKIST
jgi:hypothetical protein